MTKVYVIMDSWAIDDDGNYDNQVEAVYATLESAKANVKAEYQDGGGTRAQQIIEMDLLP